MTVYRRPDPIPLRSEPVADGARIAPLRAESEDLNHLAARQIFLAILARNWGPAAYLPKEDDLGRDLGVSRTVLREAIKTLASKSVVETRRRRGTAILGQSQWNLLDSQIITWLNDTTFVPDLGAEMLGTLATILPEMVRHLALHQGKRLAHAEAMRIATRQPNSIAQFSAFHLTIAQRMNNPFCMSVVTKVIEGLIQHREELLMRVLRDAAENRYENICDCVASGAGEEAADSVRDLLTRHLVEYTSA